MAIYSWGQHLARTTLTRLFQCGSRLLLYYYYYNILLYLNYDDKHDNSVVKEAVNGQIYFML